MKKELKFLPLPAILAGLGGFILRRALLSCADSQGRLPLNSGIAFSAWVLALAVPAAITALMLLLRRREASVAPASPLSRLLGSIAGGLGLALTALAGQRAVIYSSSALWLGQVWQILGLACLPCLLIAGICRIRGKKCLFLFHAVPTVFLVFHCLSHYQTFSSQPQIQLFLMPLLGVVSLLLFAYYVTAGDAGLERRWMRLGTGLMAVFSCLSAMDAYPGLYLGGAVWALTELVPEERA